MKKGIVNVAVKRALIDIVAHPDAIMNLAEGQHVMFKGVECVMHVCDQSEEIWFTTVDSKPEEYKAAVDEFLAGDFFANGTHPNYRAYVKHIRAPHSAVNDEPGKTTKRHRHGIDFHSHARAILKRSLFRNVIGYCEIQ